MPRSPQRTLQPPDSANDLPSTSPRATSSPSRFPQWSPRQILEVLSTLSTHSKKMQVPDLSFHSTILGIVQIQHDWKIHRVGGLLDHRPQTMLCRQVRSCGGLCASTRPRTRVVGKIVSIVRGWTSWRHFAETRRGGWGGAHGYRTKR